MRISWTPLLVLTGLAAGLGMSQTAAAAPTTYALDGGRLEVIVKYDRSAWVAGHDHVLVSTGFRGSVTWDPEDVSACKVDITLPVQTLVVDPPGSRARNGFEGETSDGDKKTIKKNALSKGQLNADAHPNITYTATKCSGSSGSVTVAGNLTIRGTTKPVQTTMTISADGSTFSAKGSFASTHTAYGFKPFSAALGAVRNDDKLGFVVNVKGKAK